MQYYTQYNSLVTATKYHTTKPIYQIKVETEKKETTNNTIFTTF